MHRVQLLLPDTSNGRGRGRFDHTAAVVVLLALMVVATASLPPYATGGPMAIQEAYKVTRTEEPPPAGIHDVVLQHVQDHAIRVLTANNEPLMDLWFAKQLPAPTAPDPHPGVAYGTLNEGVVLAVMRLHREHDDYRQQPVDPGVYVVRYLRQPDDGNHLGETTYRDYAVLTSPTTSTVAPQSFDDTLDEALDLNLHPLAWGLWPADQVPAVEEPGIVSFQPGKWALKLTLPRADGSTLAIGFVVAGNEWHY